MQKCNVKRVFACEKSQITAAKQEASSKKRKEIIMKRAKNGQQ